MIAILVDSCHACPFMEDGTEFGKPHRCSAEQRTDIPQSHDIWSPPPDWCPLRENDRLVTLRVK